MLHRYSGEKLRTLRLRANLSVYDVPRLTGISRMTLWRLESERNKPQTETLRKLLNVYAIAIAKLERLETTWEEKDADGQSQNLVVGVGIAGAVEGL
jgi:transcriptional regulator with XRE-family HTH domain